MKNIKSINEFNKINEIGPRMAAKGIFSPNMDSRGNKIKKDVITSLFREYIGQVKSFYIKTRETACQYKLIEVDFVEYGSDKNLNLYFYKEDGVEDDAPYVDNKREITITYDMIKDEYDQQSRAYEYNPYTINFLIKAANLIRQTYYTRFPITVNTSNDYNVDVEATENKKKSRLTKQHFNMFNYDNLNMLNKNID